MSKVYIIFENGRVFEGEGFGAQLESRGEAVFTTEVIDYMGTLTSPLCRGHIVVHAFPEIGNYGVITKDTPSDTCQAAAVVVRGLCDTPSNFRSEGTLDDFLKRSGVPGVFGVDTREITQILRDCGTMRAVVTPTPPPDKLPPNYFDFTAPACVTAERRELLPEGDFISHVALLDFGASHDSIKDLLALGAKVTVLPPAASADEILALAPDGLLLSDGPGDPRPLDSAIQTARLLLGKLPIFGIGLGHLVLALGAGFNISKMKYGHHGSNQPVRELSTGKVYITSQYHSYEADSASVSDKAVISHVNLNDEGCEGLSYPGLNAFSLQFHPKPQPAGAVLEHSFEKFFAMMGGK